MEILTTTECGYCGKRMIALAQCGCAKARKAEREARKAAMAARGATAYGLAQ